MSVGKGKASYLLSLLAAWSTLLAVMAALSSVLIVNWHFLVQGKGVGVYSVVFYLSVLAISGLVWGISLIGYRNWKLAIAIGLIGGLPLLFVPFIPVWFQAPAL